VYAPDPLVASYAQSCWAYPPTCVPSGVDVLSAARPQIALLSGTTLRIVKGYRVQFRIVQVYVAQVLQQCQFIIMAHADMRRASAKSVEAFYVRKDRARLEEGIRMGQDADRELWYAAQALMSAAANVAKVLWGKNATIAATREPVRNALGVADGVTWQAARHVRNNFDHYDDRIREWNESGEGLQVEGIGGPAKIVGHTRRAQWRNYDPQNDTLYFWGVVLPLGDIEAEARRLIPVAEDVLNLCPGCVDEGRSHPIVLSRERGYPAEPAALSQLLYAVRHSSGSRAWWAQLGSNQ
jgi:hypothetical protein